MSEGAQLLYFHLAMRADDDGVVETYPVMQLLGTKPDDYKVLLARNFIRQLNDEQVSLIMDWREHNLIRPDRKVDSMYKHLLLEIPNVELLEAKPRADTGKTTGRPLDNQMSAQVRLGKVRLGNINTTTETSSEEVFSLKEEIQKLEDATRRDLNVIALFLEKRSPDIKTKGQFQVLLKRHLRPAKELSYFSNEQILKACSVAEREYPQKWTIETLLKLVTK